MSDEVQQMCRKTFRRSSLTIQGVEKIEASRMAGIFGQMGQAYNDSELKAAIKKLDPQNTGLLSQEDYNKLCDQFVKDPAAIAQFDEGDKYAFKQLINISDLDRK